jgi:hypothetical protein
MLIAVTITIAGCGSDQPDMTAAEIVTQFQQRGLPIDRKVVYTAATDPNHRLGRPGQYVSKVNFHDNRLEKSEDMSIDGGGAVETFDSESDAERWYTAVSGFDKALGSGYDYWDGKRVLRLSSKLTPAQAKRYAMVFNAFS